MNNLTYHYNKLSSLTTFATLAKAGQSFLGSTVIVSFLMGQEANATRYTDEGWDNKGKQRTKKDNQAKRLRQIPEADENIPESSELIKDSHIPESKEDTGKWYNFLTQTYDDDENLPESSEDTGKKWYNFLTHITDCSKIPMKQMLSLPDPEDDNIVQKWFGQYSSEGTEHAYNYLELIMTSFKRFTRTKKGDYQMHIRDAYGAEDYELISSKIDYYERLKRRGIRRNVPQYTLTLWKELRGQWGSVMRGRRVTRVSTPRPVKKKIWKWFLNRVRDKLAFIRAYLSKNPMHKERVNQITAKWKRFLERSELN